MPFILILDKKLTNDTWSAVGSFSTSEGKVIGTADLLVKEVAPKQLLLVLDANIKVSKVNDRDVTLYTNVKPVTVASVKKGQEIIFGQIGVQLINIDKPLKK